MDKYVILFIRTSLVSLLIGSALGMVMAFEPSHGSYFLSAHVHLNLLGFMAMMIYGVGYHVLPRFSGVTIHSRPLMVAHYYLGTATLAAMAGFSEFNIGHSLIARAMFVGLRQAVREMKELLDKFCPR